MKKQERSKWTVLTRQGLAMLLVAVMLVGYLLPGGVNAVDDPTDPTVETTAPEETTGETKATEPEGTTAPTEPEETTAPAETQPEETTAPSETEPEETVPETTAPEQTEPEVTEPEQTPYEKVMADLAALEEEAKALEATLEVLDDFYARALNVYGIAFDLYDVDKLTEDEWNAVDAKFQSIVVYLKDTYGYENGQISSMVAADPDNDEKTSNANGAIKFWLFDYAGGGTTDNINYNSDGTGRTIAQYFNFRDGTNHEGEFNQPEYDKDGFVKNHATVESKLVNGYPVLDLHNLADGTTRTTNLNQSVDQSVRSLAYLFNPSTTDHAIDAYTAKNSILQLKNGRYTYNSASNAVDFNTDAKEFYVRNYTERTDTTAGYEGYSDFLPFNYTNGKVLGKVGSTDYHVNKFYTAIEQPVNYWFGMVMEVEFYMPKDGKVNGEDMKFYFSGDDDVWVFIDDVLVLDLGGTHGTVDGSINFATGEVLQYLSWNKSNTTNDDKTKGTSTSFPTTINTRYTNAGKDPNGGWNEDKTTFADYSKHTLKFFYLERGAGVANCKLDFNLPTLPPGGVTVTKELTGDSVLTDYTNNNSYTFQLLKQNTAGAFEAVSDAEFSIDNVAGGKTDADGKFTLEQGKTAVFANLETESGGVMYRIKEVDTANANLSTITYTGGNNHTVNNTEKYVDFMVHPNDGDNNISHMAVFTNELKTTDVTVSKTVTGNMGDRFKDFTFDVELYTANPIPAEGETAGVEIPYEISTFTLKHGESKKLENIPLGAYVVITETAVDGYETTNDQGEATVATLEGVISSANVEFTNRKNVTIDTGIALDSMPYIVLLVGIAAIGLILFAPKRKTGE